MNSQIKQYYLRYLQEASNRVADTYALSGESEYTQTKFEELCNTFRISVYGADSDVNQLLFITRILIDQNWDMLEVYCLLSDKDEWPRSIESYDDFTCILRNMELELLVKASSLSDLYDEVNQLYARNNPLITNKMLHLKTMGILTAQDLLDCLNAL